MSSVLIIEDDASYRNSIKLILEMEGFDVHTAENGSIGINKITANRPDLIICDIIMPHFDGHSVLEYIKNNNDIADIPFIFVSALSERTDVRSGMSEGADDYLTKPFSAEELIAAVSGRLQRIEMLRANRSKTSLTKEQLHLLRQLTARELEVLKLVGNGATSKNIAEQLGIRLNTVEVHRSNIMKKLNAENAATLARWALAI